MFILAINTATFQTEIALLKDETILYETSWKSERNEAETLLPEIQKALQKTNCTNKDLESIFVIKGPGSFSALRIGIVTANTLAFTLHIPIFTCDTFELLQARIPENMSKKCQFFLSIGSDRFTLKDQKETIQMNTEEIQHYLMQQKTKAVYVEIPAEKENQMKEILKKSLPELIFIKREELKTFGEAAQEMIKKKSPEKKLVEPIYVSNAHITTSKKPLFT